MTKLCRVVFGEPSPGGAEFAALLAKLDESVSYCNRTGTLGHDRVTDFPPSLPMFGLDFMHPTPLQFVDGQPDADDLLGILRWHRMSYYVAGATAAPIPDAHKRAAWLSKAVYGSDVNVQWRVPVTVTAGVAWAIFTDGAREYVVFRGTDFASGLLDLMRDIGGFNTERLVERALRDDQLGLMWDGFVEGMKPAWAAISKLLSPDAEERIFTGHSLGAARAGVAAALALLDRQASGAGSNVTV